jgi:hypothetical protein
MNERLANMVNIDYDYNLYYLANCQTAPAAHDLKDQDPKFVAADSDFHLQSTSPAKDAGTDVGVTSDFDGLPRPYGTRYDIGAYEYRVVGIGNQSSVIHQDIISSRPLSPNPVQAADFSRYLQQHVELNVYNLKGDMLSRDQAGKEGVYLVQDGRGGTMQKIIVVK